ncbi:MAG: 2-dehydropantoate 2-reductase N-terminal domain-containing protein, partial [Beijerinckiaceae bacterium]
MKIAILGTGGIGLGYAVFLREQGHLPVLWSPSGKGVEAFREGRSLVSAGKLTAQFRPTVADDARFVDDCDALVVTVPAYGYRTVFNAILPHIRSGTPLIISAHLSMAARHVEKSLLERGITTPVIAWGTTALMGRRTEPGSVEIGGIRKSVDIAAAD